MQVIWRDWRYGKDNWGEIPHKQGYCIYLEERKKAIQAQQKQEDVPLDKGARIRKAMEESIKARGIINE